MTNQQRTDTLCDLERRGNVTNDALEFVATAPFTYVIQLNFNNMHLGRLPLPNICAATTSLCNALQTAQVPKPEDMPFDQFPWAQRVAFVSEQLLRKQDEIELRDSCIYFVYVGKVALGKRIVEEGEFIFGKAGRRIVALRTTSVVMLVL